MSTIQKSTVTRLKALSAYLDAQMRIARARGNSANGLVRMKADLDGVIARHEARP